jgi:hypothetical protein
MVELAQILEDVWLHAVPGRESAERNEALRALYELTQPRSPANEAAVTLEARRKTMNEKNRDQPTRS